MSTRPMKTAKSIGELYAALGQKRKYSKHEVAKFIDVDEFRSGKYVKGEAYEFPMGDTKSLLEVSGKTLDELGTNIVKFIHHWYYMECEGTIEDVPIQEFRIKTYKHEDTDELRCKLIAQSKAVFVPEDDSSVYARLVSALTLQAARDRKVHESTGANDGGVMKFQKFKETLETMEVDDTTKSQLIAQYEKAHDLNHKS